MSKAAWQSQLNTIFGRAAKQIGKQNAIALTETARDSRAAVQKEIPVVFDRPVPWVKNGVYFTGASTNQNTYRTASGRVKQNQLHASVWFKDDEFHKGIPAAWMMQPQVFGGSRNLKRMEKALQRIGVLPVGMYIVPGRDARKDGYGNMSRGQITQILAYFSAFREAGHKANMTAQTRGRLAKDKKKRKTGQIVKGYEYFAVREPGDHGLHPGVYQRLQYGEKTVTRCVMFFVRTPVYQKRLPFFEIVQSTVDKNYMRHYADAAAKVGASRTVA